MISSEMHKGVYLLIELSAHDDAAPLSPRTDGNASDTLDTLHTHFRADVTDTPIAAVEPWAGTPPRVRR